MKAPFTITMLENYEVKFSPLFRIKKILLTLRFFLGFPLKPQNNEFSEFKFVPCLEYTRYSIYITIILVSHFHNFYSFMQIAQLSNPSEVYTEYFTRFLGFTMMDILVINSMPFIAWIATGFYLNSFKNIDSWINNICKTLSKLNKELHKSEILRTTNKRSGGMKLSHKLIIFGSMISIVAFVTYCAALHVVMKAIANEHPMSQAETIRFILFNVIISYSWIYPVMTMSADLIVCHTLEETSEVYLIWNKMLLHYKIKLEAIYDHQVNSYLNEPKYKVTEQKHMHEKK